MGNKPDKFGIKFWLAVDVTWSVGFRTERDEERPAGDSVSEMSS